MLINITTIVSQTTQQSKIVGDRVTCKFQYLARKEHKLSNSTAEFILQLLLFYKKYSYLSVKQYEVLDDVYTKVRGN